MQNLGKKRAPTPGRIALWAATAALAAVTVACTVLDGGARPMETAPVDAALGADQRGLDLNAATVEELDELPGIGPALAERIVAWREENGPFAGPEDIQAVSGIGPATAEAIAPYIEWG